ncbi:MAG: ATP-binding protein [Nanoarchaeota archaeon]
MFLDLIKDGSAKIKNPLSIVIKIILIFAIVNSYYYGTWHILFVNILLLLLVFLPSFVQKSYKIHIPGEFEFAILLFIIISFFLGNIRGLIIQIFLGATLGFIGFMIMFILYSNNKIKTNHSLIAIFAFSFSVSLGVILELTKYSIKLFLLYTFDASNYLFTMQSLFFVSLGALFSSTIGFIYLKTNKKTPLNFFIKRFVKRNPNLFIQQIDSPEEILELIKGGEKRNLEFKSTLRMNLYTNEKDRKIELSVLKTITGFLNSKGGTLLVGVDDEGKILGIEKDNFANKDRFNLHFTNLIKQYIGKKYFSFLNFELVQIEDKHVLKVDCFKSNKPIFLRIEGREEFYIRAGSETIQISGSELVEYIGERFSKKS